jgi:hypothetical protein
MVVPTGFPSPKSRRANVRLMSRTREALAPSRSSNDRPAITRIPIVRTYSPLTSRASAPRIGGPCAGYDGSSAVARIAKLFSSATSGS